MSPQEPKVIDPNEDKRWRVLVGAVESDPDSKLFQCCHESCNRVFTSKGSLKLHLQRKHDTPGLFACPIESCGRQFSYKHVLQTHIERVHHMPFDYTAFPNPKRQRTPRNVSALADAALQMLEAPAATAPDSDLDSEDEPVAKVLKAAAPAAVAGEFMSTFARCVFLFAVVVCCFSLLLFVTTSSQYFFLADKASSSSSRATRQTATALGNLADMAARSATLGECACRLMV